MYGRPPATASARPSASPSPGASLRGRGMAVPDRALWITGAYLLATPNLFPWYALCTIPVLAAVPAWPWISLS